MIFQQRKEQKDVMLMVVEMLYVSPTILSRTTPLRDNGCRDGNGRSCWTSLSQLNHYFRIDSWRSCLPEKKSSKIFKNFLRGADQKLCAFQHKKKHSSTFLFTRQFNFTVSQNIRSFNMNQSKKDIFDPGTVEIYFQNFKSGARRKLFTSRSHASISCPCTQSIN